MQQTACKTASMTRRDEGAKAAPSWIVYVYLAVIVATWAGNWPLMKLALTEAGPLPFVLVRLVGALILLLPLILTLRAPLLPVPGERLGLCWIGLLQVAGFLIFGIVGLAIVPAGRAIVLAYTMPLWAIPIGLWLWPESFGRRQLVGAAIGFCGLVLFMNPGLVEWSDRRALAGNGLLLLAAIFWALGSCLYRRSVWRSPFWTQTFWQLAVGAVPILVIALPEAARQPIHWSIGLFGILVYNWIVTTALGYFLWNKVLSVMSAAVAGQVLALTPIGGFLLSIAMFGGTVSGDIVASIVLIVAGIVLTLRD
jgi:drug/metabolite transporter (DMT)-like permease